MKPTAEVVAPLESSDAEAWRGSTFDDLIDLELPDVQMLIPDLFPPGTTLLGGTIKAGKSALLEWYAMPMSRHQQVAYFAFEYSEVMLAKRVKKLQELGAEPGQIQFWHKFDPQDAQMQPLHFFQKKIEELRPGIVILDTLVTVKPESQGGYQGEYMAANAVVEVAQTYDINLIVNTHTRKRSRSKDAATVSPVEEIMGSQGIGAVFDNVLVYDRPDIALTRVRGSGRLIEDFETFLSYNGGAFSIESKREAVLKWLRAEYPSAYEIAWLLIENGPMRPKELLSKINEGRMPGTHRESNAFYNQLKRLKDNNLVVQEKEKNGQCEWIGPLTDEQA